MFDDGPNITGNTGIAINEITVGSLSQAMASGGSGVLKRPVAMLSFALNQYWMGWSPIYFKSVNLAIHLLNGIGLFLLTTLLLNAYRSHFKPEFSVAHIRWISLSVAAAWLLHPFNLTSVLYVVQRMTSLAALFSICGMALYIIGRNRLNHGRHGLLFIAAAILIFTPLAALCKENGALLPLLLLTVEISIFRFRTKTQLQQRALFSIFFLSVALPAILFLLYIAARPDWLTAGYLGRPFSLYERVLTESRVLWFYMSMIVMPNNAKMGLFHDDFSISQGFFEPVGTALAILGLLLLVVAAAVARKKAPLLTFGILFFLAGHVLESSIFALEIAHEHRNYLPMYGLLLALFFHLQHPLQAIDTLRIRQGVAVILALIFAFATFSRAGNWANPFDLAVYEVSHHPDSPRNNGQMAHVHASIETKDEAAAHLNYMTARFHYEKAIGLSPSYTNGLFGLILLESKRGHTVDRSLLDELERRLASAPYSADNGDMLLKLLSCQTSKICSLQEADLERIMKAPFRNPTVSDPNMALATSAWSYYLVNVKRDHPAAIEAMKKAADLAPGFPQYRRTLIDFLRAIGREEEAVKQEQILRR